MHSCVTGYFLTKIFHPNIATNGEICVNTLKKDWNPSLGLRHVLIVSIVLFGHLTSKSHSPFYFMCFVQGQLDFDFVDFTDL